VLQLTRSARERRRQRPAAAIRRQSEYQQLLPGTALRGPAAPGTLTLSSPLLLVLPEVEEAAVISLLLLLR
jgi:hypothetical protein